MGRVRRTIISHCELHVGPSQNQSIVLVDWVRYSVMWQAASATKCPIRVESIDPSLIRTKGLTERIRKTIGTAQMAFIQARKIESSRLSLSLNLRFTSAHPPWRIATTWRVTNAVPDPVKSTCPFEYEPRVHYQNSSIGPWTIQTCDNRASLPHERLPTWGCSFPNSIVLAGHLQECQGGFELEFSGSNYDREVP